MGNANDMQLEELKYHESYTHTRWSCPRYLVASNNWICHNFFATLLYFKEIR